MEAGLKTNRSGRAAADVHLSLTADNLPPHTYHRPLPSLLAVPRWTPTRRPQWPRTSCPPTGSVAPSVTETKPQSPSSRAAPSAQSPISISACSKWQETTSALRQISRLSQPTCPPSTTTTRNQASSQPVRGLSYSKTSLTRSPDHRVNMCTLATEQTSDWLMCDAWEGLQPTYQPTAIVLDRFDDEINRVIGGVVTPDGA